MIRSTRLFRAAAILQLLFAIAHSYGFLSLEPPSEAARAVRRSMEEVRFLMDGQSFSFGDFYIGFGPFVTCAYALLAWLSWVLGSLVRRAPQAVAPIGWPLVAFYAASLALALRFFALPPAVLSAVILVCLAAAVWESGRATPA